MLKPTIFGLLLGLSFVLSACGGGDGSSADGSTTFNAANYSLPPTLSTVPDQSTINPSER